MGYLLDTVVLSELRKKQRNEFVVRWLSSVPSKELYLSVVTIGEVEKGIAGRKRVDPEFAGRLERWLADILEFYGNRILSVDVGIARRWGRLSDRLEHGGADLLIAATALEHGLNVVTRNVRHFEPAGVAVIDPFQLPRP